MKIAFQSFGSDGLEDMTMTKYDESGTWTSKTINHNDSDD